MKKKLYRSMVELTSNPIYTQLLKSFATSKLSGKLNRSFSKVYKIDESEIEGNIVDYQTLNDFFIRKLKEGSRPFDEDESLIVSPVDGMLSQIGIINKEAKFLIKEKEYSLSTLLGLENTTTRYLDGIFMLFYLSPKDYHRIHSPLNGKVVKRWALGKYSEPVNQLGLLLGEQPLATNYRLITELQHHQGRTAVVKIGALNVNSIHPSHLNTIVNKGDEMAYFTFGSSVLLLFEKGTIDLLVEPNEAGFPIKQGETIARFKR